MTPRITIAFRPNLLELERRDVPAWWSVAVPTPAEGTLGSTLATHEGELTAAPSYTVVDGNVSVFADTAATAVVKALAGTISVTINNETFDHVFGPDTVGSTVAAHKPFFTVVSGTSVAIAFEDMAGQPGCDYDYNDRSWGGVSVAARDNPVVYEGVSTMTGVMYTPNAVATSAKVTTTVTELDESTYKWNYHVLNNNFTIPSTQAFSWGIGNLYVALPGTIALTGQGSDVATKLSITPRIGGTDGVAYWGMGSDETPGLSVGQEGDFFFLTAPVPIRASAIRAWEPGVTTSMLGSTVAPADPVADITIDPIMVGTITTTFDEITEDKIGGLVVMRSEINLNKAPRTPIVIEKLTVDGQPAVGGKVEVTVEGGRVELYDKKRNGNNVASGTVFDNDKLPVTLWVQGSAWSDTMRDVKIKAKPVGIATGSDDVAFTVLWVHVTVKTAGTVADDNDKRDNYRNETVAGNYDLKLQKFVDRTGWGTEARGEVLPHDFVYPGSDLRLDRDWEKKGYINGKLVDILDFNAVIPKGNDTGPDFARDDTVSLNGFIYDWDDPGISPDLFATQSKGTVARCRHNFRSFGSITINGEYVRPSGIYAYFVRFSMRQNGPDDSKQWEVINPPDFITDNQAGLGVTNLTADLS